MLRNGIEWNRREQNGTTFKINITESNKYSNNINTRMKHYKIKYNEIEWKSTP